MLSLSPHAAEMTRPRHPRNNESSAAALELVRLKKLMESSDDPRCRLEARRYSARAWNREPNVRLGGALGRRSLSGLWPRLDRG